MNRKFISNIMIKNKHLKLTIILIIFATFFWIGLFSTRLSSKIKSMAKVESENHIYTFLYEIITDCVKKVDKTEFLIFKSNKNGELILTEYNMDKIYDLVGLINQEIQERKQEYVFFIPSGLISNSFLLNNWGAKIPVMAKMVNNIYTNVKTKVSNYGINNALVEVYIIVDVKQQLIIPFEKNTLNNKYEVLVSSYFINGKVPGFYGEKFEISSNIFDITTKI